ncbi:hypothetical protein CEXT_208621 [Caerostris extrusa]|uniref:Uncharacterized protein n=1 Tax=Caerostris extrusa TaxID=172846 RepID=A0AAV4XF43_CAEEX|nr:hypothetical protein CEXT_208621 [Caerostris extrusa]
MKKPLESVSDPHQSDSVIGSTGVTSLPTVLPPSGQVPDVFVIVHSLGFAKSDCLCLNSAAGFASDTHNALITLY